MRIFIVLCIATCMLVIVPGSAFAVEIEPPQVPEAGADLMPDDTTGFGNGLMQLLQKALWIVRPELQEASRTSLSVTVAVMLVGLLRSITGRVKTATELAGSLAVAGILMLSANSMISLAANTVRELSEYGKLLWPVMTAALAAQGGVTASAALYAGTAAFDMILTGMISRLLVPLVYLFLGLSTAASAVGEEVLAKMREMVKRLTSWCLKTLLIVFTSYMSITGVVSGTTDAAALKATRVTISSFVPVVGGILSDASEAVLVSVGLAKNAAGIYGILAVLAVFLDPFVKIGVQYLTLKLTAAVCGIFGSKPITGLIDDFSSAMGLLLAMTGSVCLMLLISTVCFLKGVS